MARPRCFEASSRFGLIRSTNQLLLPNVTQREVHCFRGSFLNALAATLTNLQASQPNRAFHSTTRAKVSELHCVFCQTRYTAVVEPTGMSSDAYSGKDSLLFEHNILSVAMRVRALTSKPACSGVAETCFWIDTSTCYYPPSLSLDFSASNLRRALSLLPPRLLSRLGRSDMRAWRGSRTQNYRGLAAKRQGKAVRGGGGGDSGSVRPGWLSVLSVHSAQSALNQVWRLARAGPS